MNHQKATQQPRIVVDLFITTTCPHCKKAEVFFHDLSKKTPWMELRVHKINENKSALKLFYQKLQKRQSSNFSVPAVFFCQSRWAGFADETTTGTMLLKALNYCHTHMTPNGKLSANVVKVLQDWGDADQFKINPNVGKSALTFIPLMALISAISPCSFFCFAIFLSFLWLYPRQFKIQLTLGGSCILFLGAFHWVRQVYESYYYQIIPWFRWPALLGGVMLLMFTLYYCRDSLFQKKTEFHRVYCLFAGVIVLLVQMYQQTCALNVTFIFNQWLSQQSVPTSLRLFYTFMYHLFYLLPLIVILIGYALLDKKRRLMRFNQSLQVAACFILLMTAGLLIISPYQLVSFSLSLLVLFVALLMGWIMSYYQKRYGVNQ